jgi:hypothetical protein
MAPHLCAEFTSHFTTNFTGTSHTVDLQIYLDQTTGTTFGFTNGFALLWVTYEYDDTSTTQVMNAWIPMTSAVGALPTSKGAAQDTVPNLDSFLGYGSISYKHIGIILEGNSSANANTTDFAVSVQLDTTTAQASDLHEDALASDIYSKEFFNLMSAGTPIFTTNATHSFYAWVSTGAVGRFNHASFTMLVTFTFDATSANAGNISLMLPQEIESPMGGTAATDSQRGDRELWIQEPATITIQKSAFRWHWNQITPIATAYFRVGSQSFVSVTDVATSVCGGNCHQRTIDDVVTLARGRNSLYADCYSSDTTDKGWNLSGVWIINYKAGKPSAGWGAANHTVIWPISFYQSAVSADYKVAATSPVLPESDHFMNGLGTKCDVMTSGTTASNAFSLFVEKLVAEGGLQWLRVYASPTHDDNEVGLTQFYGQMRDYFLRWVGDPDSSRIELETARRWRFITGSGVTVFSQIFVTITYHTISKTVSGSVTGSNGGTVNLYLHRADNLSNSQKGSLLKTTSRVGNGAYSFTWWDDTENVYVSAFEANTHLGRSENNVAT